MKLRFSLFLLCLGIVALLWSARMSVVLGQERQPDPGRADHPEATYRGGLVTPPLPKPRFTLTDTSGAPFDFWRETQGYVTLLFFGYTYCPDQCPLLAHLIYPGGVTQQDWAHDLPQLVKEVWSSRYGRSIALASAYKASVPVQLSSGAPN